MKKLFFDIETVPAHEDNHDVLREIYISTLDCIRN